MFHAELRLLRSLVAIAEENSITRAAERLNLTQPTVSGQLKDLETQLGFPLFVRTTREISATPELLDILPLAREVVLGAQRLQAAVHDMQRLRSSSFRVGAAMYTLDFPERIELIDAFTRHDPNIEFAIDNRLQHQQVKDLLDGQLDVSFLLGVSVSKLDPDPGGGAITNEITYPNSLERVVLGSRRIGLTIPEHMDLADCGPELDARLLEGRSVAVLSMEHGSALMDPIEAFFDKVGVDRIHPPEGNAHAVARYAARNDLCALDIGWFDPLPGQVFRHVQGLEQTVEFSLVLGTSPSMAAQRFLRFARTLANANRS